MKKRLFVIIVCYLVYAISMYIYCLPDSSNYIGEFCFNILMSFVFGAFILTIVKSYHKNNDHNNAIQLLFYRIIPFIVGIPMTLLAIVLFFRTFFDKDFIEVSVIFFCINGIIASKKAYDMYENDKKNNLLNKEKL